MPKPLGCKVDHRAMRGQRYAEAIGETLVCGQHRLEDLVQVLAALFSQLLQRREGCGGGGGGGGSLAGSTGQGEWEGARRGTREA
jgi:hypothetical protein